ncbi:hypothetical protein DSL92_06740 [Billgrantia gudaonensis]|uniref:RecC C-terminal domain-containing protein n=1 Tax=Billgrantia gudaonensis TaxID=376427 RepID=A0A432JII8_9GAMM|nr:hypothetical protein DSL92_06740 [Halomonas gudaonensis]
MGQLRHPDADAAIPFQRVCLLGMNDGDYPPPLDIDLMHGDYRPATARAADDRYLFLEALLSARRQLYVSWVGRSIVDNAEKPPSVLVGRPPAAGWQVEEEAEAALAALTPSTRCSRSALLPGRGETSRPGGCSPMPMVAGCASSEFTGRNRSRAKRHRPPRRFRAGNPHPGPVGQFPARSREEAFNTRLKVFLEREDITSLDHEPFTLDGLTRWQLQDALIQASAAIDAASLTTGAARHPGPPLEDGECSPWAPSPTACAKASPSRRRCSRPTETLDAWPHAIEAGRCVSTCPPATPAAGRLAGPVAQGTTPTHRCRLLLLSSSSLMARPLADRYRWASWCALGRPPGRLSRRAADHRCCSPRPATSPCRRWKQGGLKRLGHVIAWQAGMRQPLPLACDTAFAWLGKVDEHLGRQQWPRQRRLAAARKAYEGDGFPAARANTTPISPASPTSPT